ncbi:hypothetical protein [Luteitalea sp.]|uniref:hypothetical protein n=1 Tax=Luteitalea sp. TaxID=2004800 RepID=UPI0025B89956|nr:hypothetical protein [Luteitalea sp.]
MTPATAIHQPALTVPPEDYPGQLVRRVRAEYLELPALCLTFTQACRLWALDSATCERVLWYLVAEGFLTVSATGTYVRPTNACCLDASGGARRAAILAAASAVSTAP